VTICAETGCTRATLFRWRTRFEVGGIEAHRDAPLVAILRTMLSRFQRSLAELSIRHIRTQIDTPGTNGKVEAFWATLQAETLNRQQFADLAAAEAAVTYAGYYNYHRLHGELDWHTPAERFDGTPFTDRGLASVPALARVSELLDAILAA
jgi:integrase-like protein